MVGSSKNRISGSAAIARAARRLPVVIDALRSRRVHLTGLRLLVPHLIAENCEEVLARAAGKSKRDVEELVARLAPQPDRLLAIDANRAAIGPHQPEDSLDQHRFADPRAADHDEALARRTGEIDAIEHALAAEGFLEALDRDLRDRRVAHREKNASVSA